MEKLNVKPKKFIKAWDANTGEPKGVFTTSGEAGRILGISHYNINRAAKTGPEAISRGYRFKYVGIEEYNAFIKGRKTQELTPQGEAIAILIKHTDLGEEEIHYLIELLKLK